MGIFETMKCNVNLLDAAQEYGLKVKRNGFTNCIFHNDKHPSMKLYKDHYHCFSCGAHGDVTSFTAQLFELSQLDAARKLAEDFNIKCNFKNTHKGKSSNCYVDILSFYIKTLEKNSIKYAPMTPDEELHPLYTEALHLLPLYRYYMDILIHGNTNERAELIQNERRLFNELRAKNRLSRMAVR